MHKKSLSERGKACIGSQTKRRAFRSKERIIIAAFGRVIATRKMTLYKCGVPVDGPFVTTSSTRSELFGFASALLWLPAVSGHWGLQLHLKRKFCIIAINSGF
jgi:hypothetical protein